MEVFMTPAECEVSSGVTVFKRVIMGATSLSGRHFLAATVEIRLAGGSLSLWWAIVLGRMLSWRLAEAAACPKKLFQAVKLFRQHH